MNRFEKIYRFAWRFLVNTICATPVGRNWLYPQQKLASRFGRGDAEYAWRVFLSHFRILQQSGFDCAQRVLEVGPGRNLGTALLWWCYLSAHCNASVEIVCWDVFKNASPEDANFWPVLARELLDKQAKEGGGLAELLQPLILKLEIIAHGDSKPSITYRVISMDDLANQKGDFNLVYSQAAIEHIWSIEQFWKVIVRLTKAGGWHSHRIDLADHGRRESNYIEMLQWSDWAYWLTQRFVPGATNRWRAGDHIHQLQRIGIKILYHYREQRDVLPLLREDLAKPFRTSDEAELKTTALDIVARKTIGGV